MPIRELIFENLKSINQDFNFEGFNNSMDYYSTEANYSWNFKMSLVIVKFPLAKKYKQLPNLKVGLF